MRLSIVGRQLDQDSMKLNEISFTEESILTLIRVHDSTMTARYVFLTYLQMFYDK